MRPALREHYEKYFGKDNLNLGCANNVEEGFLNLDFYNKRADILHDLEVVPLPFPDNSFDCVLGSHVFEHIERLIPLVNDIHRILRPGGHLIAITPHASCDAAVEAPQHCRYFTENTWNYFDPDIYKAKTAGYGADEDVACNFKIVERTLAPFDEFLNDPDIESKRKYLRNVICEVHAVLRAEK